MIQNDIPGGEPSEKLSKGKLSKSGFLSTMLDRIALFLVRGIITLIQILPEKPAYLLSRGIISLILFFIPRSKAVAERNLRFVFPDLSDEERKGIFKRSLRALARNLLAYAKLPLFRPASANETDGAQVLAETVQAVREAHPGVGIIFCTLHYGSFELFAQIHSVILRPAWILARGFAGLPRLNDWWFSRRELYGNRIFRRKGAFSEILTRLQNDDDVVVLYDQNVKRNHAVFVDLFGTKAATTKTVALASLRTGAPVICGVLRETEPNRYEVVFEVITTKPEEGESPEANIERITRSINAAAERFILAHPENWMWIHRRFKTRPAGEAESFYSG